MIWISINLFNRKKRNINSSNINKNLKRAFNAIKEEFEDHLNAINENTGEIQANYEFMCRLDSKIDKLNEKIEEIQFFMKNVTEEDDDKQELQKSLLYKNIFLTNKEKEVFLAIYTLAEEKGPILYNSIAKRIGISEFVAREYVTNLIEKGVPIIKKYIESEVYIDIEKNFKHVQAKENIIGISENMARRFSN